MNMNKKVIKIKVRKVKDKVKICNHCDNKIMNYETTWYNPVSGKQICGNCKIRFFYDITSKRWFFSGNYAVFDKRRLDQIKHKCFELEQEFCFNIKGGR